MNGIGKRDSVSMSDRETCKVCEEGLASLSMELRTVEHGRHGSHVEVDVLLPTWSCDHCGMSYLADGAEDIQHDAICEKLGRLKPRQIIAMRKKTSLNQVAFAEDLGIASSSLKRWESGAAIQDRNHDRILRDFMDAVPTASEPIFRFPPTDRNRIRAGRFLLRKNVATYAEYQAAA